MGEGFFPQQEGPRGLQHGRLGGKAEVPGLRRGHEEEAPWMPHGLWALGISVHLLYLGPWSPWTRELGSPAAALRVCFPALPPEKAVLGALQAGVASASPCTPSSPSCAAAALPQRSLLGILAPCLAFELWSWGLVVPGHTLQEGTLCNCLSGGQSVGLWVWKRTFSSSLPLGLCASLFLWFSEQPGVGAPVLGPGPQPHSITSVCKASPVPGQPACVPLLSPDSQAGVGSQRVSSQS